MSGCSIYLFIYDNIMQIPGHLAVALAQYCLIPSRRQSGSMLKPLLLASLFPDLVDKTIGYIFHAMPNGRHYAHNIFSLIAISLLVTLIWGRVIGFAWFVGYLGHLAADSQNLVPWFFPVKKYNFSKGRLSFHPTQLFQETMYLILVLMIYYIRRQQDRGAKAIAPR